MSSQSSFDSQLWAELEPDQASRLWTELEIDQASRKSELCNLAICSASRGLKTFSQSLDLAVKRLEILGLELAKELMG